MRASLLLTLTTVLFLATVPPVEGNHDSPEPVAVMEAHYLAGTVHTHVHALGPGGHQAVGPVDCSGLLTTPFGDLGGTCFDLTGFEGADLVLYADDSVSPTRPSIFAGFDADGDHCVGCEPGADPAWEGVGSLGATAEGHTFAVFVRALSAGDGASVGGTTPPATVATFGHLRLEIFAPGDGPCIDNGTVEDRNVGHDTLADELLGPDLHHEAPPCGQAFQSPLPYWYPCLPAC